MHHDASIFMFHKPKGVTVTRQDERGCKTVYDLLPPWALSDGWIPVGRLDKETRGLLLFVREGRLMDALSRPGVHPKLYEAWVRGRVTEQQAQALCHGVDTPLGPMRASQVALRGGVGAKSRLHITLHEGKNRQIRRLIAALRDERGRAMKVLELKRVQFGPLSLDVSSGKWRMLSESEVQALLPAGLNPES